MIKVGEIVTLDISEQASNTFYVDQLINDEALLNHPLNPTVFIKAKQSDLNKVQPNMPDSIERHINYVKTNLKFLDYNTTLDLECLSTYFLLKRQLPPRQKNVLSAIRGILAEIRFNNNLETTMNFIVKHYTMLDDYNMMWYKNFKYVFDEPSTIKTQKQRTAIFNIAGYLLAELDMKITN